MKLSQASSHFNQLAVEGWDRGTSTWIPNVATGSFQVFDRFIADRSFGQRKRNFVTGGDVRIPAQYSAIRFEDGTVYLLEASNRDLQPGGSVASVYLLHQAPFVANIMRMVTTPRSNGAPGTPTPTQIDTAFLDLDRYSFIDSDGFDAVRYGVYTAVLSADATVDTENWLVVDGVEYDVREISSQLDLTYLRVVKRSAA